MKVLIVDDSALFRKGISQALAGEAGIDVLGVASNGKIALMKILQEKPDLIVLDLEMPEMDGLSVIKEIRRQNLAIWILVFSDQSERGAKKALEALAAGADDFLSKSIVKAEGDSVLHIRNELSPRIRQFMKETFVVQPEPIKEILPNLDHSYFSSKPQLFVIASSTGGPEALRKIFSNLKGYRGPPILIVQHMPPIFTKQLAQLLAEHSGWTVKEAEEGELMQSNTAYLAPGDFHMVLRQRLGKYYLALSSADKVKSVRPSADVLFKSIAEFYRSQVWAFVLTGMGEDGLDGVRELKKHRARIFIQDQNSSIVWGMPGAIAKENLQNRVLDLNEIASLILKQEEL